MSINLFKTLIGLFVLTAAVFLQISGGIIFFSIQPNLILLTFFSLLFFSWRLSDLALSLAAIFYLVGHPLHWLEAGKLVLILFAAAFIFERFFEGKSILTFLILIAAGTLSLYALLDASKLFSYFLIIGAETIFNLILGVLVYLIIAPAYAQEPKFRRNF